MDKTELEVVIAAGAAIGDLREKSGQFFQIIPKGYEVNHLKELSTNPVRAMGYATLNDLGSFINYVNLYKTKETVILVNPDTNQITAIFDYHGELPGWKEHGVIFDLRVTPEYKAWLALATENGQIVQRTINQEQFVEFIEDYIHTIYEPAGAQLKEICLNLTARREENIANAYNAQNGDIQLVFQQNTNIKGPKDISIPSEIILGLIPFAGSDPYKVSLRLKTRIKEGKLNFAIKFNRLDQVRELITNDICGNISKNLPGIPIFNGKSL